MPHPLQRATVKPGRWRCPIPGTVKHIEQKVNRHAVGVQMSIVPYTHLAHAYKVKNAHVTANAHHAQPVVQSAQTAMEMLASGNAKDRSSVGSYILPFHRVCMLVSLGHL
jgi:hypothetical protein